MINDIYICYTSTIYIYVYVSIHHLSVYVYIVNYNEYTP